MIIGLTGLAGSGKTTVSRYLAQNYGFKCVNFKDGLVAEMKQRLPRTLLALSLIHDGDYGDIDWLFQNKPPIMRTLMQEYGTEVRRADDPEYWIAQWKQSIEPNQNFVADDVRFLNELAAVREAGGVIIRVTRPDITSTGEHKSETEQLDFEVDFTIEGVPGSHESIYKQVDSIIQTLKSNND